jgi:L-asparaginase II
VHAVAVRAGNVLAAVGDPDLVTFARSSIKPIQALLAVRAHLDLAPEEIAIMCASHQGEPAQLAAVRRLLDRVDSTEDDLECGVDSGRLASSLQHPCSGKHAGFIAACRARGWPVAGYRLPEHPLQQQLLTEVATAAGLPAEAIPTAVDGCGVVTFALSLAGTARAFTMLPEVDGGDRVLDAMRAHPELIGGAGTVDTELMRVLPGWVSKRGAEGLLGVLAPDGTGIALKVEDGSQRGVRPGLAAFLATLGVHLGPAFERVGVRNSRSEEVGEVTVG